MLAVLHAPAFIGFGIGLTINRAITRGAAAGCRWLIKWLQQRGTRVPFTAVSACSVDWGQNQRNRDAVTYFMKPLFTDPQSGQKVTLVRYPAGQINPAHSHAQGHGMYVLQGSLRTHRGTFGPNTFVWFPAGEVMWHGAGTDEELVALFMAGGNLSTDYVESEFSSAPGSRAE